MNSGYNESLDSKFDSEKKYQRDNKEEAGRMLLSKQRDCTDKRGKGERFMAFRTGVPHPATSCNE